MAVGSFAHIGLVRYMGSWDASSNAGTGSNTAGSATTGPYTGLFNNSGYAANVISVNTSGTMTPVNGDYWQVHTSGSTTINSISTWGVNDWIIYSGSTWIRIAVGEVVASLLPGYTTPLFSVSSTGMVGIGTTSADNPFELLSSTTPQFRITNTDATDYATFSVDTDGQLDITTVGGGTNISHLCLMPEGNVGIGTTTPAQPLHIKGSNAFVKMEGTDAVGVEWTMGVEGEDNFIIRDDTGDNKRLVINSSGNVGIGATTPAQPLHIKSSNAFIKMEGTDAPNVEWTMGVEGEDNFVIRDDTGPYKRLVIDSSGNVGIGSASPATTLHVAGVVSATGTTAGAPAYTFVGDTDTGMYSGGANAIKFAIGGALAMTIDSSKKVTLAGDLQVDGTTTTVNSTVTTLDDPIITLGGDTAPGSDDNKDRGVEFRWHNGSAAKVGFFGYDDDAAVFTFIPDATNSSEVFSGTAGNVAFGNIAGTLTTAAQTNITSIGTLSSLTITGDLTVDTNTLFVDASENKVGIGTTSPESALHVQTPNSHCSITLKRDAQDEGDVGLNLDGGTGGKIWYIVQQGSSDNLTFWDSNGDAARVTFESGGDVGIGTAAPAARLHVTTAVDGGWAAFIANTDSANSHGLEINAGNDANDTALKIADHDGSNEFFRIRGSGNVGIGTSSPSTKLTVEGAVTLKEQANADSDTAAYGQLWVKSNSPCDLYFTDDSGQDVQITSDGSLSSAGSMSNFILEDGDGTEVTISNAKEVKFVEGAGIDINWTDVDNGTDGDPYDLTFTVSDTTVAGDSGSTGMTPGDTLTIAGGTNATTAMSGDTLTVNVDDAFLKNDASDTTTGTITAGGFTTTGTWTFDEYTSGTIGITTVQDSGTSFNDNDTSLMTAAAIADKIDTEVSAAGGGDITGVTLAGDSGTAEDLTANVNLTVAGGNGITTAGSSTTLTVALDAALTTVTSAYNTSLKIGRDSQNLVDFATTDNNIIFRANNEDQLVLTDGYLTPASNAIVDLGTDALEFNNAYFDGTVEADAYTVAGTALDEYIADTVGAMVGSNTESGITVAYQDGDNTLDFTVGTLNQDTSGTAAIATTVTITDNENTNEENAVIFTAGGDVDGGNLGLESDGDLTYNPSTGTLTATIFKGNVDAVDGDFDGTLEADAYTVAGVALNEYIADTVGAMVGSNTESGITVAYQDGDNTLDFTVGTLNQDTSGTAAIATTVTITDNESTNENNAIIFTAGGDVDGGNLGLESDGDLTYNPSTGKVSATIVAGSTSLQTALIEYTDGDDSMTIADGGKVTFAAGFDVGSDAAGDILYHNGTSYTRLAKGSADQVLTMNDGATAPGWEDASGGGGAVSAVANGADDRITTFSSSTALNGEANLTFDGSTLTVTGDAVVTNDLTLNSDAAVLTFGAGSDVTFTHDNGTGMDIVSAGDLDISSTAGSITATVVDGQTVTLGKASHNSIVISPHGTPGSELILVQNVSGTTDGADAAGAIELDAQAGGIGLAWADDKDLWAEGGRAVITANEDAADCIKLHADAGSSQTISVLNDAGTAVTAIGLTASAGGIKLNSGLDNAASIHLVGTGMTFDGGDKDDSFLFNNSAISLEQISAPSSTTNKLYNVGGTLTWNGTSVGGAVAITDLDIDGGTDISADLDDADLIVVDDGAGGTNRKCTMGRVKTYVGNQFAIVIQGFTYSHTSNTYFRTIVGSAGGVGQWTTAEVGTTTNATDTMTIDFQLAGPSGATFIAPAACNITALRGYVKAASGADILTAKLYKATGTDNTSGTSDAMTATQISAGVAMSAATNGSCYTMSESMSSNNALAAGESLLLGFSADGTSTQKNYFTITLLGEWT